MSQAVDEPEQGEHGYSGGLGEGDVDSTHQQQTYGEQPAGADAVREHPADELADGIGHGLAAGDQTCQQGPKGTFLCSQHSSGVCRITAVLAYIRLHANIYGLDKLDSSYEAIAVVNNSHNVENNANYI